MKDNERSEKRKCRNDNEIKDVERIRMGRALCIKLIVHNVGIWEERTIYGIHLYASLETIKIYDKISIGHDDIMLARPM